MPINSARRSMEQLIETAEVRYAWLGVATRTVTPSLARELDLPGLHGAAIESVVPRSPAARPGSGPATSDRPARGHRTSVAGGDVVIAIDGRRVSSSEDLVRIVSGRLFPGQTARFTVLRDGERLDRAGRPRRPSGEPRRPALLVRARFADRYPRRLMLQLINVGHKSLGDYATLVGPTVMDQIRDAGRAARRASASSTSRRPPSAAASPRSTTRSSRSCATPGSTTEWRVIYGQDEFFEVTKTIHNALQGSPEGLDEAQQGDLRGATTAGTPRRSRGRVTTSSSSTTRSRRRWSSTPPHAAAHWIWRCHIDLSAPNRQVARLPRAVARALRRRRSSTAAEYVPPVDDLPPRSSGRRRSTRLRRRTWPSRPRTPRYIVDQFGIDVERPLLTQVSRFDPWKDPLGVIDAYRRRARRAPGRPARARRLDGARRPRGLGLLQPDGRVRASGDPDIYILSNLNNVGSVEVNAFQVHSAAVLQKSIREGFGLTVTEALWKARPVVAGRVGGIVDQIQDGETGLPRRLGRRSAPRRCLEILADPERGAAMALRGQGVRAAPLPHAAAAARLARALQPSARERHGRHELVVAGAA